MDNNSGIWPVGFAVLILPDPIEDATESGIITVTETNKDRQQLAQVDGVVVGLGPNVWCDEPNPRAKVGDRVIFSKYAGMVRKGKDGKDYRLINDKDIQAVLS